MYKKTGYRQMLRDRTPRVIILALKWCKATTSWVDHVYDTQIGIFADKEERNKTTRLLLGLDKGSRVFNFEDTIAEDNMTSEEISYWNTVKMWVSWFQQKYAYIENAYKISKNKGDSIEDIKIDIMKSYLYSYCPTQNDSDKEKERKNAFINKLCDYLIDCFENRI